MAAQEKDIAKDSNGNGDASLGIEVTEVEFSEFDRRQKPPVQAQQRRYERRGFVGKVDTLIQEIHINTARAYSSKDRKK